MTVTKREILEDIQRVAEELGRPPKHEEYKKFGQFSPSTAERKFGSWNEAVLEAGLEPHRHTNVSREDILEDIERVTEELGRKPKLSELNERGRYGKELYVKHDWEDAFRPSPEEIIESIQDLAEELGKRPTQREYREKGKYRLSDVKREFEYWNTATQEAGYTTKEGRPRDA
jgi:hypothetical protein